MSDFDSSTRIGGVYVEIAAPTTKLRSDVAAAKAVAADAERTIRIKVPLMLEASSLRAELPRLISAVQSSVRPITIPVVFKVAGGPMVGPNVGGLATGGGGGLVRWTGGMGGGGGGSPPPISGMGGGASSGGGWYSVSGGSGAGWQGGYAGSYSQTTYGARYRSGTLGAPISPVVPPGLAPAGGGGMNRLAIGLISAELIGQGLRAAGNVVTSYRDYQSTDPLRSTRGQIGLLHAAQGLPLGIGGAVQFATQYSGADRAFARVEAMQEARGQAQIESLARRKSIEGDFAAIRGDEVGVAKAAVAGRVSAAKQLAYAGGDTGLAAREQRLGNLQIAEAGRLVQAGYRRENEAYDVATARARAVGDARAGDDEAGILGQRAADKMALQSQLGARLDTVKDPTLRKHIQSSNKAELALFDEESERDKAERQKHRAADVLTAVSAAQEAGLRIAGKSYEADLKAFDTATKAKLSLINDLAARQNEAARSGAERAVIVDQQNRETRAIITGATGSMESSNLRIGRNFRAAAIKDYDTNAFLQLDAANGKPGFEAVQAALMAGRQALVAGQQFDRGELMASLGTRRVEAVLSAGGRNQTAVAVRRIAEIESEIRGANPDDLAQVTATGRDELAALRIQILRQRIDSKGTGIRHGSLLAYGRRPGPEAQLVAAAEAKAARLPDATDLLNDAIKNPGGKGGAAGNGNNPQLGKMIAVLIEILQKIGGAATTS